VEIPNRIPCLLGHCHTFKNVEFVDVPFTSFIKINGSGTETTTIYCLEALDDSSVARLHKWCHVGLEKLEIRSIFDGWYEIL
jgi:hypothetical protein